MSSKIYNMSSKPITEKQIYLELVFYLIKCLLLPMGNSYVIDTDVIILIIQILKANVNVCAVKRIL